MAKSGRLGACVVLLHVALAIITMIWIDRSRAGDHATRNRTTEIYSGH